jgi:diaminopimelate epimerase
MRFIKAHAYGNDFLYVERRDLLGVAEGALPAVARQLCDRHTGIGADGLIIYERTPEGAVMKLFNADGSYAETSGNGVRGLGAALADASGSVRVELTIQTDVGPRRLTRTAREGSRQTFRTGMGLPRDVRQVQAKIAGESLELVLMDVGNPQCVIVGPLPNEERFVRICSALERHKMFPRGINIEFAQVDTDGTIRIRIWERGVGPTQSSGTGSCAALVAAASFGGAPRATQVVAPGGPQLVEWRDDGVYLTGWAEIVCDGTWRRPLPR